MSKQPEQLYIDGTEPPPDPDRTTDDDARVHAWLDAKTAQRKAADETKLAHSVLIAALQERGVTRYPYVDAFTGKKRYVVVEPIVKAKTTKAPKPPRAKKPRKERNKPDPAGAVEHRKVSRESVAAEIDPFGTTREAMP
jgi:hypothetical protein